MNIKNIIKKQTTVIAIAVVLVAVTAIGVSYSLFFDVKGSDKNQVVTAGTLNVTFNNKDSISQIKADVLTDSEGLASTPISYTINNSGNLPATYKLYIVLGSDSAVAANNIRLSLDGDTTKGITAKTLTELTSASDTGISGTVYQVESSTVEANKSLPTKYLRVWVKESDSAINGKLQLSLHIVSEVNEATATQN